jgi:hypothetical protein
MAKAIEKSIAEKPLQWLLVTGVLGTGLYFLVKSIRPDKGERILEDAETDVSKDNPFSYTQFLSQTIPAGTPLLKVETARAAAKQIYDSLNTFFNDDEDITIGVFSSLSSKVKVAQVCKEFFDMYKKDILEFLKTGAKTFDFGTGGLSKEDYQRILTIVSKKPKF